MMNDNAVLIRKWIEWQRARGLRDASLKTRFYTLGAFAKCHDLRSANVDDVTAWLARLPGGPASRSGHLDSLRSFYRFSVPRHVAGDPTAEIPAVRVPRRHPRPVPSQVLADALEQADDRTRFMLLLGAYAGLRRGEIATLHSDCIGDTHLTITGKGGVTRAVPTHPILLPYMDFSGWAFPSPLGDHLTPATVGEIIKRALGSPWTAHTLRHSFASRAYAASRDLRAVQVLLGHASLLTTQLYVTAEHDSMRAAVMALD